MAPLSASGVFDVLAAVLINDDLAGSQRHSTRRNLKRYSCWGRRIGSSLPVEPDNVQMCTWMNYGRVVAAKRQVF
jgi:hypothetical protein